jgi:superfamily I DNA/RNA helicase
VSITSSPLVSWRYPRPVKLRSDATDPSDRHQFSQPRRRRHPACRQPRGRRENRVGKSNLLHAIRLVLDPSLSNAARWLRREDFNHEQMTTLVAELQNVGSDTAAHELIKALLPLGLRPLLEDPGSSQDGRQLERLRIALTPDGELHDLTVVDLGDRARAKGRVMAATIHGAKGLEFDVVIVCDCEEGRMPHWGSILGEDPAAIEEDRRKFYVSLTRARRRVHLVWSAWRISKNGNPYGIGVSRFVRDLTR